MCQFQNWRLKAMRKRGAGVKLRTKASMCASQLRPLRVERVRNQRGNLVGRNAAVHGGIDGADSLCPQRRISIEPHALSYHAVAPRALVDTPLIVKVLGIG